jgi:hypothetical protein
MPSPSERPADARAAFTQWASSQAGSPRGVSSLIEDVERADEHVGLLTTEVQGRRAVWKTIAFGGKARVTFPSISVESVDAWSADAKSVRDSSDHVAMCDACGGVGKSTCDSCSGGTVTCSSCNGQRKMYGYAANGSRRLLNCQTCRGKGELDCAHCRRGVATCPQCAGGGRVQRWIELEWWRRAISDARPEGIAHTLGWPPNATADMLAPDADVLLDVDKPHRLTLSDLGATPMQWLSQLSPALQPGERIARQHLRIGRLAIHTVRYRLGNTIDRVPFIGYRFIPPSANSRSAFSDRAARLRSLRWLLWSVFLVVGLVSLGRGPASWSVPTLLSLIATAGALFAINGGVAEWTAARRSTHRWLLACAMFVAVAIGCAVAAKPRITETQQVATTPAALPVVDTNALLRERRWNEAADAIVAARARGVAEAELKPLFDAIGVAGVQAVDAAALQSDARGRLAARIAAEAILIAWERASGTWGTPPLIALRTEMARDVATLEKAARRRRS